MYWTVHLDGGPRRVNHAAVCVGENIYSFGGYCSREEFNDWTPIPVHVLKTATLRWAEVSYICSDASNSPFQRYGHTVVEYKRKVYMWGGRNNTTAFGKLMCFNIDTLEWACPVVTGSTPFPKDGHSACRIDNIMYIFGGFEDASDQYTSDVHCLNLDTMVWTLMYTKGAIPINRDFHSAVPIGTSMYIFGGRSDGEDPDRPGEDYHSKVVCLNTLSGEWIAVQTVGESPIGRRSHSAWAYNGEMYIFGGYNGILKTHFNDVFKFTPLRKEWTKLNIQGKVPHKRRRQVCVMHKTKMFLFGGTSPGKPPSENQEEDNENLLDNGDLYVLDFEPSLRTLCINNVIENNLDSRLLPKEIILDIKSVTVPNKISRCLNTTG